MKVKTNFLIMSILLVCGCIKYGLDVKGSNGSETKLVSNANLDSEAEGTESVQCVEGEDISEIYDREQITDYDGNVSQDLETSESLKVKAFTKSFIKMSDVSNYIGQLYISNTESLSIYDLIGDVYASKVGSFKIDNAIGLVCVESESTSVVHDFVGRMSLSSVHVHKIDDFVGELTVNGDIDEISNFTGTLIVNGNIGSLKDFVGELKVTGQIASQSNIVMSP